MKDILIIGSGAAGLSAALKAKALGSSVVVLSKTFPTASQTSQAQGGVNAVLEQSNDSVKKHIEDTLKSSHNIGDEKNISYMCYSAKDIIKWLDDIGVPFSRDKNNNIAQRKLGGASNARACYSSDYTGLKIIHTLYDNCIKQNIEFLNEYMVVDFIIEDNTIKGVVALEIKTSKIIQILASKVILATGGYAGIYHNNTTNSTASTGEIVSIAYKNGVKLSNMEFVQFHPTALKESCVLVSESARGEGGYLVTKDGKRFVDELSPRDVVAREIYKKLQENQEVFLDLRHLGLDKILELMPQEYNLVKQFSSKELDKDLISIKPVAHYSMGGVDVDIDGKTNIKNLFAVGECANNHVHGANRLGGNSLLEVVTFGLRVGEVCALQNVEDIEEKEYKEFKLYQKKIDNLFKINPTKNFYEYKDTLGDLMFENVGLFRSKESLDKAIEILENIKDDIVNMGITDKTKIYNTNLKEFLEFENMITVSKIIAEAAIKRQECRGAHYRVDFKDIVL